MAQLEVVIEMMRKTQWTSTVWLSALAVVVLATVYVGAGVAGVLLISRRRVGLWISMAALMAQSIYFSVGGVGYSMVSIIGVLVTVYPGVSWSIFLGTSGEIWFRNPELVNVAGLNLVPILALGGLIRHWEDSRATSQVQDESTNV